MLQLILNWLGGPVISAARMTPREASRTERPAKER